MKITITFKDPSAFDYAFEKVKSQEKVTKIKKALRKWIEFEEYVYLEYDTDKKTLNIVKSKEPY